MSWGETLMLLMARSLSSAESGNGVNAIFCMRVAWDVVLLVEGVLFVCVPSAMVLLPQLSNIGERKTESESEKNVLICMMIPYMFDISVVYYKMKKNENEIGCGKRI